MLFSSDVIVHRWESDQHLKIQRRSISKSLFTCWGLADPKWVNWNKNSIFSTYYATRYRLQFLFNMFIFAGFMKYITSFRSLLFADSCRQFLLSNCIQSWKWNRNDEMASSFHILQITQLKTLRTVFHEPLEATKSEFWANLRLLDLAKFTLHFSKSVHRRMCKHGLWRIRHLVEWLKSILDRFPNMIYGQSSSRK